MIRKIVLMIAIIGLSACQVGHLTTLYNDETSIEKDGVRVDAQGNPITGVYHKYSKTMRLMEDVHYVDGVPDGRYVVYNNKGKIIICKNCSTSIPVL